MCERRGYNGASDPGSRCRASGGWLRVGAEAGLEDPGCGPARGAFISTSHQVRSSPTWSKTEWGWVDGLIAPSRSREALVAMEIWVGSVRWGWLVA